MEFRMSSACAGPCERQNDCCEVTGRAARVLPRERGLNCWGGACDQMQRRRGAARGRREYARPA